MSRENVDLVRRVYDEWAASRALEGPWKIKYKTHVYADDPRTGWREVSLQSEAEAIAVRDALNQVAGGVSRALPEPTDESILVSREFLRSARDYGKRLVEFAERELGKP